MTPLAPLLSGLLAVQAPAGAVAVCKPTDNACNARLYEQRAAQTTDPIRRAKYLVAAAASHLGYYDGSHEVRSLCAAWRAHAQSAAILGEEHPGAAALRRELAAREARPKCTLAGPRKTRAALASAERPRQQPPSNLPAASLAPAERPLEDSTSSPATPPLAQAAPADSPVAGRASEADAPTLLSVPTDARVGTPSPRGDASRMKERAVAPPSPRVDDPRPGRGLVLAGGVTLGVGVALAAAAGSMGRRMVETRRELFILDSEIDGYATDAQAAAGEALLADYRAQAPPTLALAAAGGTTVLLAVILTSIGGRRMARAASRTAFAPTPGGVMLHLRF